MYEDSKSGEDLVCMSIPLPIFYKVGMRVDIVKECTGIADG